MLGLIRLREHIGQRDATGRMVNGKPGRRPKRITMSTSLLASNCPAQAPADAAGQVQGAWSPPDAASASPVADSTPDAGLRPEAGEGG